MIRFSQRSQLGRDTNPIAQALQLARDAGRDIIDLSCGNPTLCDHEVDAETLALLGDRRGTRYQPQARGLTTARQALCQHYRQRGMTIEPNQLLLTASTSEAYRLVLELLCDPGDRVLLPRPAYPLMPMLAQLCCLEVASYPLLRDEYWRMDLDTIARELARGNVRAVLLVHPGNPTGMFARRDDAAALQQLCAAHGAALIVDEVFADYAHGELCPSRLPSFAGQDGPADIFVLSGLSKVALLPQAKLSWLLANGPNCNAAMQRLELMADTFLSVSTAVQLALPGLLTVGEEQRRRAHQRLQQNLRLLDEQLAAGGDDCPLRRLPCDGGWYALVEIPRTRSDEAWVLAALERDVYLHPGYFYDLDHDGVMVVSLLLPSERFANAIERLLELWRAA